MGFCLASQTPTQVATVELCQFFMHRWSDVLYRSSMRLAGTRMLCVYTIYRMCGCIYICAIPDHTHSAHFRLSWRYIEVANLLPDPISLFECLASLVSLLATFPFCFCFIVFACSHRTRAINHCFTCSSWQQGRDEQTWTSQDMTFPLISGSTSQDWSS